MFSQTFLKYQVGSKAYGLAKVSDVDVPGTIPISICGSLNSATRAHWLYAKMWPKPGNNYER